MINETTKHVLRLGRNRIGRSDPIEINPNPLFKIMPKYRCFFKETVYVTQKAMLPSPEMDMLQGY